MLLISILLSFCTRAYEHKNLVDSIGLLIIPREIHIKNGNSAFDFEVQLTNFSSRNFILYGFRRTFEPIGNDSIMYESKGASCSIFIKGKNVPEEIEISISDEVDNKQITEDTLRNVFTELKEQYLETTEVIAAKKVRKVKMNHKFTLFQLPKGEYQVYLIYSSGDLSDIIESEKIKRDEKKYNATKFQGWVKSNTVQLIVE